MKVCARESCRQPVVGRKSSAVYCSVSCNDQALTERRAAEKWKGVDPNRPCAECGTPLTGMRPHAVYCSRSCKSKAASARAVADGRAQKYDRARYQREAEKRREYARRYLAENPERMRVVRRRRKGQIRGDTLRFTERDWSRLVARYRGCCAYCGTPSSALHREHVLPLKLGGRHSVGNILPACPRCNLSKHTMLLSVWRHRVLIPGRR